MIDGPTALHWIPDFAKPDPPNRPLLDTRELLAIEYLVRDAPDVGSRYRREIERSVIGDANTRRLGHSLDYEESRAYQSGDDSRFINWRLTARTGQPYVKIFREQSQPCRFVLMDRRTSLRFGTHVRLKVAQAAVVAALVLFEAVAEGANIAGLLCENSLSWLPERGSRAAALESLRAITAPCPPDFSGVHELSLGATLRQMEAALPAGAVVILISDFFDLVDADRASLMRLSARHHVAAVQILDAAELALPDAGQVDLSTASTWMPVGLNSSDASTRAAYTHAAEGFLAQRRQWFKAAAIPLLRIMADDALEQVAARVLAMLAAIRQSVS